MLLLSGALDDDEGSEEKLLVSSLLALSLELLVSLGAELEELSFEVLLELDELLDEELAELSLEEDVPQLPLCSFLISALRSAIFCLCHSRCSVAFSRLTLCVRCQARCSCT